MKSLIALSFLVGISSAHALPVASHEAIRGLFSTPAFEQAEQQVLSHIKAYDRLSIETVWTDDKTMMAICHPSGAISKSGTNLKVVFTLDYNHATETHYFETSYQPEDFRHCTP